MNTKLLGILALGLVFFSGCTTSIQPENTIKNPSPLKDFVGAEKENIKKVTAGLSIEKISETSDSIVFDIVLSNPNQEKVQSIQSWFTYPTKILEGVEIDIISADIFDLTAPGEKDFDTKNGLVKIGISVGGKAKITDETLPLARITFNKISSSPYFLDFYDIGLNGHTKVMSFTQTGIRDILNPEKIIKFSP